MRRGRGTTGKSAMAGGGLAGRCVVLVGPEGRGKDMMIAAARRRFSADASLTFPERVTTRPVGALGAEQSVSRRTFQELQADGALLVDWESGGRSFGVPRDCAAALDSGATVVFAGTPEAVSKCRSLGLDVRLVEIGAGPDGMRSRAGVAASAAAAARIAGRAAVPANACTDSALCHTGEMADAVRRFHDFLHALRIETLASPAVKSVVAGKRGRPPGKRPAARPAAARR